MWFWLKFCIKGCFPYQLPMISAAPRDFLTTVLNLPPEKFSDSIDWLRHTHTQMSKRIIPLDGINYFVLFHYYLFVNFREKFNFFLNWIQHTKINWKLITQQNKHVNIFQKQIYFDTSHTLPLAYIWRRKERWKNIKYLF